MKTAERNTKQQKSISNTLCREDNKRNLKKKKDDFCGGRMSCTFFCNLLPLEE